MSIPAQAPMGQLLMTACTSTQQTPSTPIPTTELFVIERTAASIERHASNSTIQRLRNTHLHSSSRPFTSRANPTPDRPFECDAGRRSRRRPRHHQIPGRMHGAVPNSDRVSLSRHHDPSRRVPRSPVSNGLSTPRLLRPHSPGR